MKHLISTSLAVTLIASASAQTTLYEAGATDPESRFGESIGRAADIDGDGVAEVIAGAPFSASGAFARVLSGASGATLHTFTAPDLPGALLGCSVAGGDGAVADVNGDGVPDLIAGAPPFGAGPGHARVYSGADGSELHTFQGDNNGDTFGAAVLIPGDLNADGRADLVVGATVFSTNNKTGYVRAFSGADGSVLYTALPPGPGQMMMGQALATIDDLDGDGVVDLIVGAPGFNTPGRALVLSGASGAHLFELLGNGLFDRLGGTVADVGDIDGDGLHDIAAGTINQNLGAGYVKVFSGLDGSTLRTHAAIGVVFYGDSVTGMGDLDGDGLDDYAVGARNGASTGVASPPSDPGFIDLFSGADGRLITRIEGEVYSDYFAITATSPGDVNGDGVRDLALGAPQIITNGGPGFVRLVSPCPLPIQTYCTAKLSSVGCLPQIAGSGTASLTGPDDLFVTASEIQSKQNGLFFWGRAENLLPFGGGLICAVVEQRVGAQNSGGNGPPIDCSGSFSLHFSQSYMQTQGIQAGDTVRGQWWYRDTGFAPPVNMGLSNAILFTVCP